MKLKHQLAILTASLLLGACSAENLLDTQAPPEVEENDPMRREVLLTFKNLLKLKPVETRAVDGIATEAENYIETLDVYVFGSKDEAGPYTFQELHYYRDDAADVTIPGVESHSFGLRAGSDADDLTKANTSGLLKLKKGLFVKLYCVANRTTLYQTDDAGIVTPFDGFKSLLQDKPGQADNTVTVGVPTETAFKKLHTKLIDPAVVDATIDDVLVPSLPMTGAYTTPLDLTDFGTSARTQISFKLTRMVARFDLVNDAAASKFTIEHIALGNGQSAAQFFPIKTMVTDPAKLIVYPKREVAAITQQTATSLTKGAFYTWPSPKEDEGYLILSGSYAVNATEKIKVSYKVPFQQIVNNVGTYIEVAHNHRYTIGITKATDYHLDFTLQVAEWEDGEEMDRYEPDNDFDQGQTLALDAASNRGAYVQSDGKISLLAAPGSGFGFEMGSNTALVDTILFTPGSEKWIKQVAVTPVTRASSMEMLYTYAVDDTKLTDPTKLLPVTIRLTNPASGMRKEIKIVATKGPEVSLVENGSLYSKFDAATMTATMYNVTGQEMVFHVLSETRQGGTAEAPTEVTGSTVAAADSWISCGGDENLASTDYKLTLTAQQTDGMSTTVTFTSIASRAITRINVELKSAEMTALTAADIKVDAPDLVNFTGGTGGIPKVTLASAVGSSMTINITSPEGVTATATGGSDWLDVAVTENGKVTARIKSDATGLNVAKSDGKITITNVLDSTESIIIEVATMVAVEPEVPEP